MKEDRRESERYFTSEIIHNLLKDQSFTLDSASIWRIVGQFTKYLLGFVLIVCKVSSRLVWIDHVVI